MNVEIYVSRDGIHPFHEWMDRIKDLVVRDRINVRIARMRSGNFGDSKYLKGGVHELKIDYGPGYRIYYGRDGFEKIILLCGGDKKTQNGDIEKAKEYWQDYKKEKRATYCSL